VDSTLNLGGVDMKQKNELEREIIECRSSDSGYKRYLPKDIKGEFINTRQNQYRTSL
jgi:hypothetical protein